MDIPVRRGRWTGMSILRRKAGLNSKEKMMAHIRIQDENREIADPREIAEFLKPFGIQYERWEVAGRLTPQSTNEEILQVYAPEINRLRQQGGYVTADVINVNPNTPNLDGMLKKFSREHTHSE